MHDEIGGYFELEFSGRHYLHEDALALNSGRNCLKLLVELRDVRRIWIPDYICDAVTTACQQSNIEIVQYEIGEDFLPTHITDFSEGDYLYLVDYFGQLSNFSIDQFYGLSSGRLIVDAAQSYYREYREDVDVIYTCRKFFGVPDGSFLRLRNAEEFDAKKLKLDSSSTRMDHLIGRLELSASCFYNSYQKNEEMFYSLPVRRMSAITQCLLSGIDYKRAKETREENFTFLDDVLRDINKISVRFSVAPYAYPFMLSRKDSDIVRQQLIDNKVYVPTLWPNVIRDISDDKIAFEYARSLIPLPIDQRYDKEDMKTILNLISSVIDM